MKKSKILISSLILTLVFNSMAFSMEENNKIEKEIESKIEQEKKKTNKKKIFIYAKKKFIKKIIDKFIVECIKEEEKTLSIDPEKRRQIFINILNNENIIDIFKSILNKKIEEYIKNNEFKVNIEKYVKEAINKMKTKIKDIKETFENTPTIFSNDLACTPLKTEISNEKIFSSVSEIFRKNYFEEIEKKLMPKMQEINKFKEEQNEKDEENIAKRKENIEIERQRVIHEKMFKNFLAKYPNEDYENFKEKNKKEIEKIEEIIKYNKEILECCNKGKPILGKIDFLKRTIKQIITSNINNIYNKIKNYKEINKELDKFNELIEDYVCFQEIKLIKEEMNKLKQNRENAQKKFKECVESFNNYKNFKEECEEIQSFFEYNKKFLTFLFLSQTNEENKNITNIVESFFKNKKILPTCIALNPEKIKMIQEIISDANNYINNLRQFIISYEKKITQTDSELLKTIDEKQLNQTLEKIKLLLNNILPEAQKQKELLLNFTKYFKQTIKNNEK